MRCQKDSYILLHVCRVSERLVYSAVWWYHKDILTPYPSASHRWDRPIRENVGCQVHVHPTYTVCHTPTTHMAPLRINCCPGAAGCSRQFGTDLSNEMHGIIETFKFHRNIQVSHPYTPARHQWVTAKTRVRRVSERIVYLLQMFPHPTNQQATKSTRPEW